MGGEWKLRLRKVTPRKVAFIKSHPKWTVRRVAARLNLGIGTISQIRTGTYPWMPKRKWLPKRPERSAASVRKPTVT